MPGAGHGTVISSTTPNTTGSIYVDDNNGSGSYGTGAQDAVNETRATITPGDVVTVSWDTRKNTLQVDGVGTRATGDVDEDCTQITITDKGDTALVGTVNISSQYGNNSGFGGQTGVTCGNVDGEASFLA